MPDKQTSEVEIYNASSLRCCESFSPFLEELKQAQLSRMKPFKRGLVLLHKSLTLLVLLDALRVRKQSSTIFKTVRRTYIPQLNILYIPSENEIFGFPSGCHQILGLTIKALFEKFQSVLFLDPHNSGQICIFPLYLFTLLVAILE